MSNPNQLPVALKESYDTFLHAVSKPLRISKPERQELRRLDPRYFLVWSLGMFAGGEYSVNFTAGDPYIKDSFKGMQSALPLMGSYVQTVRGQELDLRRGKLAREVRALAAAAPQKPKAAESYATVSVAAADLTHGILKVTDPATTAFNIHSIPRTPGIRIRNNQGAATIEVPQRIAAEDVRAQLNGPVGHVATMGPGLSGANFARDASGAVDTVHFVSGGFGSEFINRFIENQLRDSGLPDGSLPKREYYEDGIAHGVTQMREVLQEKNAKLGIFVMSAVHHAGIEECQAGIVGAHELLEDGGILAVKAPRTSPEHFAGFDTLGPLINDVGFQVVAAGPSPRLLSPAVPGQLQTQLPSAYALFQKS